MSIKYRIIRAVAGLLMKADPYILRELVVGDPSRFHIHANPRKRIKAEHHDKNM